MARRSRTPEARESPEGGAVSPGRGKEPAVLVREPFENLIGQSARGVEVAALVRRLVRERQAPGHAGVVLEQAVDVVVADETPADAACEQKAGVAAADRKSV